MASTSIKLVGGLSAKDAAAFAREMGCVPEYLQGMRKTQDFTAFACFVRNYTPHPIPIAVPLGQLEARPTLTPMQYERLIVANRRRYAADAQEAPAATEQPVNDFPNPDLL
jgi:hypothetical protein